MGGGLLQGELRRRARRWVGGDRGGLQSAHPAWRSVELLSAVAAFRLPLCHGARRAHGERRLPGSEGTVSSSSSGSVSTCDSKRICPRLTVMRELRRRVGREGGGQ